MCAHTGIWDLLPSQEVVDTVHAALRDQEGKDLSVIARELCQKAGSKHPNAPDDMTVVIVVFVFDYRRWPAKILDRIKDPRFGSTTRNILTTLTPAIRNAPTSLAHNP